MMKSRNKETQEETFDIVQMPEKMPLVENKNAVMLEKIRTVDSILNACPQLLINSMRNLNAALNDIGHKSEDDAKEQLVAALDTLNEDLKKQEAIENYLAVIEENQVSPAVLYGMEIKEVNRADDVMWPTLNKYLESVEKKFLED